MEELQLNGFYLLCWFVGLGAWELRTLLFLSAYPPLCVCLSRQRKGRIRSSTASQLIGGILKPARPFLLSLPSSVSPPLARIGKAIETLVINMTQRECFVSTPFLEVSVSEVLNTFIPFDLVIQIFISRKERFLYKGVHHSITYNNDKQEIDLNVP